MFFCSCLLCADLAMAQEDPVGMVAAAVRTRGHECIDPKSVSPVPEHMPPDVKSWFINCKNASYKVTFIGDRAPKVEPIRKR